MNLPAYSRNTVCFQASTGSAIRRNIGSKFFDYAKRKNVDNSRVKLVAEKLGMNGQADMIKPRVPVVRRLLPFEYEYRFTEYEYDFKSLRTGDQREVSKEVVLAPRRKDAHQTHLQGVAKGGE